MTDFNNPTWSAEPVTDDKLNMRLRDNMLALKNPASDTATLLSNVAMSSTSFANLTGLDCGITSQGGDIFILLSAPVTFSGSSAGYLTLLFDGQALGGSDGIIAISRDDMINIYWLIEAPLAGIHTVQVQGKVLSGGTLVALTNSHLVMREMS